MNESFGPECFGGEDYPAIPDEQLTAGTDAINPAHYKSHPSGVECWRVAECFPYHIGVAIAYLWRCDLKGTPILDIEKAINHLRREV